MKRIIAIYVGLFLTVIVFAQVPQKMSYQAVIRNGSNVLVASKSIGMQISILQGTNTGSAVYVERQFPNTNSNGLVTIEIGGGTVVAGTFAGINWANGPYFIKTETDLNGGASYTIIGTSELLSVPYALFSSGGLPNGTETGQMLYWNGSAWIMVTPGMNNQTLSYCNGIPTWGPCPETLPTISSVTVTFIEATTASSGGNITNDGGSTITARGVCWSTSTKPTTSNSTTSNGTGIGSFTSSLTGLTASTKYYLRAYATNNVGTSYGNEVSFTTGTAPNIVIGASYLGGIIAYILQSGDAGYDANVKHGLIAAKSDQGSTVDWGCKGKAISGADGTAIGDGYQNTIDILAGCSTAGIAAKLCWDLSVTVGAVTYTDWYLPSKDELNKLYINRASIGGFASSNDYYWSSSECSADNAWGQFMNLGNGDCGLKGQPYYNVRAIRSF